MGAGRPRGPTTALVSARSEAEGANPEMLAAASERGPTLVTRGHDAGLEDIAAGIGDFRIPARIQEPAHNVPVLARVVSMKAGPLSSPVSES